MANTKKVEKKKLEEGIRMYFKDGICYKADENGYVEIPKETDQINSEGK